jgi:predicted nucleic acid-binding protein
MTLVADASVMVKIHVAEQGSDAALCNRRCESLSRLSSRYGRFGPTLALDEPTGFE